MNVKKEDTQVSNYVVQHLPRNPSIFSGEDGEDLQKWLKGYARVARYNHWDETLCLTKVYFYLSGTALKWFENNEESIQTWKEFTSQLENVFGKKENSKLQAEKKLKTRVQLKGESTECYIQDLLCLCKEVDPQMSEEDKISHLMKGIAEELYQALLPRDVQSTEQFITECRRVEALRCRRVTPTRYERLPNVASLCDQDDGEYMSSLIRQIVREEVQRALGSPREEPKNATIEEIVKEEIGRTLAPISKSRRSPPQKEKPRQFLNTRYEAETIRPHPEPRYPKQGGRRDTNEWRTTEGKPICFHCGRPGPVVRYCRDRRREYEEGQNWYYKHRDRQEPRTFYNSRSSQEPNNDLPRENRRRYRSPSPYTGRKGQYSSPDRRPSQSPRRSQDQEDHLEEEPEDDSTNFQEEDIPTERTQQPQTREEISGPITRSRALRLRILGKEVQIENSDHQPMDMLGDFLCQQQSLTSSKLSRGHLANDCWFRDKQKQGYQKKWTPGYRNHKYSREHSNSLVDTMKSGINEQAFETYVKEFEDSPDERNDRQIWCIDSGCTAHLTPNITLMENVVDYESEINLAEKGKTTQATAKGDMRLTTCTSEGQENIRIKDILHVPSLRNNFLSVYKLVNKGNSVIFNKDGAKIYNEVKPLQLIHMDLCGPMPCQSSGGSKYFLVIVDDYSRRIFESLRIIVALATQQNLIIKTYDVKTAYLYGELKETVFMRQLEGFIQKGEENKVCKLEKSLYGLPQSGKCWNKKINEILYQLGMIRTKCDPCVYKLQRGEEYAILGLYVDDLIIAGTSKEINDNLASEIEKYATLTEKKDSEPFIGIEIKRAEDGFYLFQTHYIDTILHRFGLEECNSVQTPGDQNQNADEYLDSKPVDKTVYQEMIGSLMYLSTGTRPDISFNVSNLSQMVETRSGKMQDPAQERIKAEESAKPQPGATIGGDASSDPVVLNPNIDIPKYDGTEDPRPWIESLEEIGFLYHWADYIISRYAAMNMIGSAKTWLNLHKISFTSWENFKSRLIEDFASDANKEEIKMKLNRMQQWNEPAIRFAEDILVLCNKVDPQMEEKTKINWVIGGLIHLNPPKNTNELLEICKKLDLFEKNYQERAEKSKALYNGPRSPRPHHQEQWKNATSFRRPYQNTSKPQAPAPRYYQNTSKPQAPTPRYYQDKPLPQVSAPRRSYTPNPEPKPVYPSKTYNKNPNSIRNRTEDGRPICFKCNKPGHVARYCRVKFIRILEEDPADTQEKVEEKCQMNEISEKSGPRLYADIGTFEALVDTGADLSVVDLRTALDTGHGISKLAKICAGPDGKKLDMVGSIFLNIKIDDETLSHNFVILKTHLRTLILGRDFLKKMNAKIDCKQETIKYNLKNNHDEINFEMLKIKSAKDSIVPECSMKLIKALVETEDGEYIIEESSKMFQTNGLRLARSLINVINRETHIWITNPYPRPLKIMKNQTLAFGSSPAKINVSREIEVEENKEPRFQINENLSPKEQKELKQVLERYGDLFSSRLGRTNLAKHRIDTEDAKPIKHKPYRVSAKERDIIKEQIDEMLTEGIIRPSSSPWSFPVILVKKRDGKYRFCVDYRKLNNVTVKDVYPIPRIDEVMDTLQGSTHFSAIDLRSGYWQVEVEERDKEKTAFTTAHGLYEFNVMPFGLCNAPATFERNMENMLGNLRWQICLCYLDDVIIYSPDFPTHLKRLEAVFRCFRESNLRLNDKKCRFAFEELEILGYITSKHGIKPAEHNIKAVRNFPRPKKVKEVQSFLGMCSYYRKFIKDFSKIADPLTNLIKKSVSFIWTERQEEAFQTLKTALLSPPILGHFNPNAPTYVHTDASNIGIGATLVQDIGGEEKVISYLSRTLSKAEQNYSTTEKECLAVVWSMSKLRPYLYGRHFKIVTDHHALCWLKNLKDPTGRLARWALKIQEYDFDIIHKSGKKHLDADGLSRGPLPETDWDEDFERLFLNQITDEEDKFIESVKKNLNGSRRSIAQNFKEEDGCLFKKNPNPEGRAWLLVVPEKKKREIMKEYHNHMSNGHLGVARTMYRIKSKYFWPSMLKDVSEFVKTCHLCQSRKGSNQLPSGLLQPIPPANFPFERIGIDFVGPLPSTKNRKKWIIVLTDYYTRYAETKAVSEATVKEVSKFLVEDIFLRHGAPQYLISDRGSQFTSNLMKEVMKTCKIKHCFTTSYHPQTNGLTERLNRTLINMLSMYVNTDQKNWDEILPFITHAYNTTIQETTGYSPFFLMFGREPTSLLDDRNISVDIDKDDYDEYIKHHLDKINRTRKLVINNTIKTQERMKKNYDKKHMERSYEPGELVAVWTPIRKIGKCEKLLRKYFGPYKILKKLSNVNYLIEPKDNPGQDPLIVHVSRIKPYFERIDEVNHEDVTTSGEGEVMVETRSGKMQDPAQERIKAEESAKPQPGATIYIYIEFNRMVETRSGKMQDPAQERIQAEESAKTQPGATIGRDASSDPVVLNPNIDIPKFDGTEDPRPWIESLEEIGFLYHWADYIISRYAAMNMIGSAKTWLNLHKISFTSWENFKSRLIQDFASDANKEEMKMRLNRMQQWNEPAIRFAEDILVLCNKVDPQMEEETKINWVIGGLKKEYSFALHLNPPKNTNELLEICKKLDLFEKNYQERAEKSKALYNGPRSPRPHHQEQWKNATSFRRPYQNTSKPQAPAPRYYQNTSKPQAPTPRYYQNKPLPQVSAPRRSYTPNPEPKPVYPSKTYNKNPNSNRNRTEDGRPICFKCNKPGHVARYCRVRFVRIVEEDPMVTQDKVEEEIRMDNGTQKSRPLLYADLDPKYKMNINVDRIGICEALIDTGADLSVVDLNTALNTGLEIINPDKMCSGPDGKELDIVGNIILNIKFDDKTITHQFVIMRTHLRIFILGRDFLKKMNAKIDCQREIIKYDLTENRDVIKYQQKKIKSAKDAIIPELSIKLINAFVEAEDGEYIIEENHKMFQTNGLRLARSLINVVNKETYIWITNPYPRPLKILKNQTLCFGSQPAEVNLVEESEQKEHEEPQFQINENLAYKEKEQLKQVLERYEDLFSSGLGRSNLAKHRIDTEGAKPIKHKPYRVSAKEREIIKEQIDEMLRDGIIRPSSSPWSFPVILVKKRDGKYRFCVDYRKLNDVTVKDVYPIPRIDDVMDTLQGSKYFSAIDLRSGYWQVEIKEKDKEKTAFTTTHGLYEFNVMPFGLCNAPATFERNMDNVLGNLRWQICLCYLDDVIIYSSDFPTHLKRLEAVLKCFSESNLKLNDKKCRFAFEELEILGHITNQQGIKPAEYNIKAVRDFPQPKKVKEVQSFLGMCSYYRKFIKDFSLIADPLTGLIRKNAQFTWTEKQEEAFQNLKKALINPPILGHFDPNAATYIHTDASNIGLGATLVQIICGEEKVISYLSRTLSKAEQNYSTTEKECLAVVWAISKLRPYLYGRHFKIITDHHALCWLKNLKDPTGRLARWALKIQEYDFDIIHKAGKKHMDVDGLSRGPLPEMDWVEDYERLFLNQIINEEDEFIENVKKSLKGSKRAITQNFKEENGCLYKKNPNPEGRAWLLVVPKKRRKEIMSEFHNHMLNGHLGVARTTYRLKNKYHWPSMLKDVSEFVKTCHLCQSRKGSNQSPSGLLQPIPPANYPFERIGIDFVGPLPSTKRRRKWIIVLTDYYTRYAETKAVSEATVKEVSTFLIEQIFLRHGAPRFLISDRGSQFTSNLMKEVMKMCKVKHCFTTSYHPQTNGLTERLNRTLINMISMYVNTDQKNWDEILPFVTHAYNTTIQETTGYSPFFLLFGREPMSLLDDDNIPIDSNMNNYDEYIENYLDKIARTRQVVINNTEKTQERMKRNYDKKHNERIYEPGHLVAVWTPVRKIGKCEKLLRKYFGPYRILKKLSNVNYLIEPKDNPGQDPLIVHVSRLKPYFERIDEVTHEDVTTSGEGE
ncbi:hypothetical protein LAZ67_8003042, partial [Cordylochernes scorpioides]